MTSEGGDRRGCAHDGARADDVVGAGGEDGVSRPEAAVGALDVAEYSVPTDQPEADGTMAWDSTTVIVVRAAAGEATGLGWTYAGPGCARVISGELASVVAGRDAMDVPACNDAMVGACRNLGRPGLASAAISAVDVALWDLKGRLLGLSLTDLLGAARSDVPVYGSGGFTTYDDATTEAQLRRWVEQWRIPRVKIKIGESWGTCEGRDLHRIDLARRVIGETTELYVDANGGYTRKQAVRVGRQAADQYGVTWFEEPVSSDDLEGLRLVRDLCPVDVAAGEYGYDLWYFHHMLAAGAVDCLQADASRCGGYTTWLRAAAAAQAANLQISGHCAPNLHAHAAMGVPNLRHLEYFHDHHRIEHLFFDGCLAPDGGSMTPDRNRPGHGLVLKETDVEQYRTS
jgi:L-alanine-DL-glutamate epimerase-like enolase superfamily enzyme